MDSDHNDDVDSGGTLREILADLAVVGSTDSETPPPLTGTPLWSFSNAASRPSPSTSSRPSPLPRTSSMHRPSHQPRTSSSGHVSLSSTNDPVIAQSPFSTPSRSIFSSGPATATVSINTAQASMSHALPSGMSRPLSVLTSPSSSNRKAVVRDLPGLVAPDHSGSSRRARIQVPEKDVDDPSSLPLDDMAVNAAPLKLSKLFAGDTGSHSISRPTSYLRSASSIGNMRGGNLSNLGDHLLSRALMDGRHSDITINAFGSTYKLHRIILDRVPFFCTALSGSWAESSASEISLHPEEMDNNITKDAFELALKRIYGCEIPIEEEQEALSLFATGCWLDMSDLVDSSVESLLRQMHPSKLAEFISLVTGNYYGRAGDRILQSAKAVLCRDGWEMPYDYWDGIPADIIREVIGGDAFFIPSEWERWYLTVRLLNRRLKAKAIEAGLVAENGRFVHPKPTSLKFFAVRFDTVYRQDSMLGRQVADKDQEWVALYTSPDIAPLLVLLDEGIHYVHLMFEQLQQIKSQRDILGVPVVPEKVISNALWMSMELRQRVVNAQESDQELGLSQAAADDPSEEDDGLGLPPPTEVSLKGKELQHDEVPNEIDSDSWDMNGRPRKFWIPSTDSSSLLGGTTEAYTAAALSNVASWTPHMTRLSASLEPADAQWATDFMANGPETLQGHSRNMSNDRPRYSYYPPFRFSAEFPNPRTVKEKKRIYSQTFWYAGSMWNLYIQRQHTTKTQQLGIYLHRAKERDVSSEAAPLSQLTVDDRIGQLEREMLLRKTERRDRRWGAAVSSSGGEADPEDETSGSGGDMEASVGPADREVSQRARRIRGSADLLALHTTSDSSTATVQADRPPGEYLAESDEENDELAKASRKFSVPTMLPYVDARPTIRTYFKIYSPSKAGRMLSVYESAPDRFNFKQSWGWKSSQMVLDDGMGGKDGKLRYMVVIGIV